MPYKCVHCSEMYDDTSKAVLEGCEKCGSRFFFYIRKEQLNKMKELELAEEMSPEEKKQVEKDIREISGLEGEETPVFLDFESIKIIKPGKYLLDITNLFSTTKPRIYKLEDGKYVVDLSSYAPQKKKRE
ncbi:hypothetical protein D6817_01840 [Candidatus Pacearchaeota archaeon]|nr:MAG: hypothetical protein D6817_01840 [Candidatus Pacearchaeota archaeon]